ncbi:MAG: hypothetical protein IT320_27210 [Anaerolineae bacterium]|nr:hypothetical protein [Anaerolineae bacterium]
MATIANMTIEQLKQLVEETIDERLTRLLGTFENDRADDADSSLSWAEISTLVEQHRKTPQPGGKSSLDMLREDRESGCHITSSMRAS